MDRVAKSSRKIVSAEEIIRQIQQGNKVILVDHNDRENEGDLVIAAEKLSPDDVNFIITHCRGVMCLCITEEDQKRLGLELMPRKNLKPGDNTANFTISIEAADGISTGVSAFDRCNTIRKAVNRKSTHLDIRTPGHVFPLVASNGGLLTRRGHTEASVTVASMAGLIPAAVISEILCKDGQVACLDELVDFAEEHNICIGFVEEIAEYAQIKNFVMA